jgi:hypothetical protein
MKEINLKGLTKEQIEKAKSCTNQEELLRLAKEEGVELNEEQLEAVSGGACTSSTKCPACGCRSFNWDEGQHVRRYYCCKCHEFVYEIYF